MDFRHHQDITRAKTRQLILFFIFYTVVFVMTTNLIYLGYLVYFKYYSHGAVVGSTFFENIKNAYLYFDSHMFYMSVFTLSTLIFGFSVKAYDLRKKGVSGIVESLGGRRISPDNVNFKHKVLYNIVEEIAVAAVIPVPDVYVLPREESINAFAVGNSIYDAAIGVTSGALEKLNRAELQSVVAHEFSHIVNSDCKLNMHLISITYGYYMWFEVSRSLLESFSRRSRSSDKNEGPVLMLLFILFGFGFMSYLFSKAIKSSISRTREYLADATSVQFTRNPDSLATVLMKIREGGKKIAKQNSASYAEHSFSFFSNHMGSHQNYFASHPPLEDRIRKISGVNLEKLKIVYPNQGDGDSVASFAAAPSDNNKAKKDNLVEGAVEDFLAAYLSFDRDTSSKNLEKLASYFDKENLNLVSTKIKDLKDKDELELFKTLERSVYNIKQYSKEHKTSLAKALVYLIEHDGVIDLRELLLFEFCSRSLAISKLKQASTLNIFDAENELIEAFKAYKKTHKKTKVDHITSLSIEILDDIPASINPQRVYDSIMSIKANRSVKSTFLKSYKFKMDINSNEDFTLIDHLLFAVFN